MKRINLFSQVQKRRIGKVIVIDVKGCLTGLWARKLKSEIDSLIKGAKGNMIVINLKSLEDIDSLGIKILVESLPEHQESGFLNWNLAVMDMFNSVSLPKGIRILKNEEDLVNHFGKYLVSGKESPLDENRKYSRINTALPLKFKCQGIKGEPCEFRAVVTNLSEGGLFAEYIDLEDAVKSQSFVDPYELKMLDLEIRLPSQQMVAARGKVVRRELEGEQVGVGIEFYKISESNREKVKAFLASQLGS